MIKTNTSLSNEEINILKSFEGQRLSSYEMKSVGGNEAWSTVRLHFENGSVDIVSALQIIQEDDQGMADEFSVLRVHKVTSPDEPLVPEIEEDSHNREVNRNVIGFSISNDCVSYYSNDVWDSEIIYTQAILIDLGTDYLCIDKEAWFSEILFVKGGDKTEELVHDDSSSLEIDPEEDPNSRMEYSSEIVAL